MKELFKDRPVIITPGIYWHSFNLVNPEYDALIKDYKRKAALDKLSKEEKELLGLDCK